MQFPDQFYEWIEEKKLDLEALSDEEVLQYFTEYVKGQSANLLEYYKKETPNIVKNNELTHNDFKKKHLVHWKDALELLEMHIEICIRSGSNFSENRILTTDTLYENHIGLLIRLHAKACLTANEILCLLKNGFADAAHARWRSLHEINVTLKFIQTFGPKCSERFIAHEIYDSYYGMKSHKNHEHRLQEKGPSEHDCEVITKLFRNAIKKYGKEFDSQYGWAIPFLNNSSGKAGFQSIEKAVNLDHMRPYFKWASQRIHINTKTIIKSLSLPYDENQTLNIGPSNYGLTDPAQGMAISLGQATAWLIMTEESEKNVITINLLSELGQTIGREFLKAARKLEF
ncbi:DUF5677 domain-containing protein [Enterobacter hormaechei]|nr:hypothetical protein [Enterobacter hormaechei]EKU9457434.1 hypothetical protein [Enterobacter hormaechei]MCE1950833.1 DUF5677 domain-containing protein [Enterobacter hormaechei]MCE1963976.1 DUF5677 domain-containing protein [Enterobacter hormaechei]HCM9328756.1 hypothetical protein [Enterobacter hormaechei subsp. steigerwaltii]